ncbi:MAG: ISNCY family transposase [Candidatus Acidiferrum sp.]
MTQVERDRLVALKKAKKGIIRQRIAAEELSLSIRQVQRLLKALKKDGDKAVVHGSRGKPSNRQIDQKVEREVVKILSAPVYEGFGSTLAMEYLRDKHGITVSKETVRQWMMRAKLWKGKKARVKEIHTWRPRRSRFGELVQWDTSTHDWLEGRGEDVYLIAMIDDATSRLFARFVGSDSTEENMKLLWSYLEKFGRPVSFYTDKASLFQTAGKRKRDEPGVDKDPREMPPTQIGRALQELGISWIGAHSAQAKGRVERNFETAQDRLVKGMRVAGVKTIEQANHYLINDYLAWWDRELTVEAAHVDDAHRPLEKSHNLAASLSYVETRQVRPDYTFPWYRTNYVIEQGSIVSRLRGATVRVEERLDGSLAARYGDRYLAIESAPEPQKAADRKKPSTRSRAGGGNKAWGKDFDLKRGPKLWQAARASGHGGGGE